MIDQEARILVVDDEEQCLVLVQMQLAFAGYTHVDVRRDSRDVPALIQQQEYTVALIDLSMPHMDGHRLMKSFREHCPDLPVIVVTASDDAETAITCIREGAFDYLVKPVRKQRLLPSVKRAIEVARLRRENHHLKEFLIAEDRAEDEEDVAGLSLETTEKILRSARKEFRFLAERVPVPFFVAAPPSGQLQFCNDAYARFFGFDSGSAAVASGAGLLQMLFPEHRERIVRHMAEGVAVNGVEVKGESPTGGHFTAVLSCAAQDDGYWTGSFIDVTEQVLLRSQFNHANKMEAIGRFASSIAHDFNNVLASVVGAADLILIEPGVTEVIAEHVRDLKTAAESATSLTRELLAYGRGAVGEAEAISAHEVIETSRGWLFRLLDSEVQIALNLGAETDQVMMESSHLQQILMNLTINAHDAIQETGTILIETATVDIESTDAVADEGRIGTHLALSVADDGCGMSKDTLARIFEPFFTTKKDGTGLGLATVLRLVHQYGGEVEVESKEHCGTTVTIRLPLASEPATV